MTVGVHGTSEELYKSIAEKCPDCLLLDLQMPGTSGLAVLNYLHQRQICIPTIVITGHDEKTSCEACMNAGAIAYMLKPLNADRLIEMVENVYSKPQLETLPSFT